MSWAATPPKKWTERRKQYVRLVAQGYTKAEIAAAMVVTPKTVEHYQCNAMWMLSAHTMPHMISRALQEGIITLADTLRFAVYHPTDNEKEAARSLLAAP